MAQSTGEQQSRPNIVFILTDDQRWDALSCMGHPFFKTPNMDRIANEGAKFTNFFVSIPLCSPSRANFLTGQYAHKNGIIDNNNHDKLSHQLKTYPQLLQQAGYETGFFGKWHMGNDATPREGFDKWVCMHGQGQYIDCPLNVDGKEVRSKGYITEVLTDYAVEFLKQPRTKPFLLYFPHKACHAPFKPAEKYKDLYADEAITPPASLDDDLSGKPALKMHEHAHFVLGPTSKPSTQMIRDQLRTLASVDESVGRVLDTLKETGQLDNTIVIYSSDNGFFWGEHRLWDKRAAYDESIRDPLLIRYPKLIKPGTVIDQLVLNLDIAPTALELAGVKIPESYAGRSLLPLFKGDVAGWRDTILTEYFREKQYPNTESWQSVRTDRWKLIHFTTVKDMDELYDLKTDPNEMKNVISDPANKETLDQLRAKLGELLKQTK